MFIVVLIGYLPSKLAQNRRGIRRIDDEMLKISPAALGVQKTNEKQASLGFSGQNSPPLGGEKNGGSIEEKSPPEGRRKFCIGFFEEISQLRQNEANFRATRQEAAEKLSLIHI